MAPHRTKESKTPPTPPSSRRMQSILPTGGPPSTGKLSDLMGGMGNLYTEDPDLSNCQSNRARGRAGHRIVCVYGDAIEAITVKAKGAPTAGVQGKDSVRTNPSKKFTHKVSKKILPQVLPGTKGNGGLGKRVPGKNGVAMVKKNKKYFNNTAREFIARQDAFGHDEGESDDDYDWLAKHPGGIS
ncbi:hypothetical protein BU23DRAFT_568643 [Bimuria novae-zelandiae CBS 107.79]|uniref:Uncharacterized protein n=1 Tax=Bimuria novae-zelandiae CBS 107.79 TaxID=1447943 RepID=A0A6A5V7D6_9PLEO|nr:hypothetical protein BU23DRAFT_568643 [Bimuria novae-zelandiae CBS 107.79]